jgi:hypothetical protein
MKKFLLIVVLFFCTFISNAQFVDIIQLIATPEKFHGKKIKTRGYLVYRFENQTLYFSEEAFLQGYHGVHVSFSKNVFEGVDIATEYCYEYVLLSGKFLGLEEDGSPMRWARVGELVEIDTCLLNGVKENLKKKKRELQRKKRKLNKQKKRKKAK